MKDGGEDNVEGKLVEDNVLAEELDTSKLDTGSVELSSSPLPTVVLVPTTRSLPDTVVGKLARLDAVVDDEVDDDDDGTLLLLAKSDVNF